MLSLIGIIVGLILMILLAYKGHSIIWVAPLYPFLPSSILLSQTLSCGILSGATGSASGGLSIALAVSQCTHKDSYKDILVTSVIIPFVAAILMVVVWSLAVL